MGTTARSLPCVTVVALRSLYTTNRLAIAAYRNADRSTKDHPCEDFPGVTVSYYSSGREMDTYSKAWNIACRYYSSYLARLNVYDENTTPAR